MTMACELPHTRFNPCGADLKAPFYQEEGKKEDPHE